MKKQTGGDIIYKPCSNLKMVTGSDSMRQREWSLLNGAQNCLLLNFTINKQGKLWHLRHYKNHLVHEKKGITQRMLVHPTLTMKR